MDGRKELNIKLDSVVRYCALKRSTYRDVKRGHVKADFEIVHKTFLME